MAGGYLDAIIKDIRITNNDLPLNVMIRNPTDSPVYSSIAGGYLDAIINDIRITNNDLPLNVMIRNPADNPVYSNLVGGYIESVVNSIRVVNGETMLDAMIRNPADNPVYNNLVGGYIESVVNSIRVVNGESLLDVNIANPQALLGNNVDLPESVNVDDLEFQTVLMEAQRTALSTIFDASIDRSIKSQNEINEMLMKNMTLMNQTMADMLDTLEDISNHTDRTARGVV